MDAFPACGGEIHKSKIQSAFLTGSVKFQVQPHPVYMDAFPACGGEIHKSKVQSAFLTGSIEFQVQPHPRYMDAFPACGGETHKSKVQSAFLTGRLSSRKRSAENNRTAHSPVAAVFDRHQLSTIP